MYIYPLLFDFQSTIDVATIFGYLMGINRSVVLTTEEVEPANPLQDMVFERGKYDFTRKEGEQGDIGK